MCGRHDRLTWSTSSCAQHASELWRSRGCVQVYLPTVSVQLAFELVFSEELPGQVLVQVALVHSSDGNEMFALRLNTMQVLLYTIDRASGQVVRRVETLEGVAAMIALDFRPSLQPKGD